MNFFHTCTLIILTALLISCSGNNRSHKAGDKMNADSSEEIKQNPSANEVQVKPVGLKETATQIITFLSQKQFSRILNYIHPELGLRISPYSFIDPKNDLQFTKKEFGDLPDNPEVFKWGIYDGSGKEIKLNFNKYYEKFIYDVDFANPEKISENASLAHGNSINNIQDIYSDCEYIEYYFSGFEEQYGGMDWRALRLVFKKEANSYYLVGIIHDQWTI